MPPPTRAEEEQEDEAKSGTLPAMPEGDRTQSSVKGRNTRKKSCENWDQQHKDRKWRADTQADHEGTTKRKLWKQAQGEAKETKDGKR